MKVRKFNENINSFGWSIEKFDELGKLQKELRKVYPYLIDFLKIAKKDDFGEGLFKNPIINYVHVTNDDKYIKISMNIKGSPIYIGLSKEETKDFIDYLSDPYTYNDRKKYNL